MKNNQQNNRTKHMVVIQERRFLLQFFRSSVNFCFCLRKPNFIFYSMHVFFPFCGNIWQFHVCSLVIIFSRKKRNQIYKLYFGDTESVMQYDSIWVGSFMVDWNRAQLNSMVSLCICMIWRFKWYQILLTFDCLNSFC